MLVEYIDPCSMKNGGVTFRKLSHLRLNGKVKNPTHILTPLRNSPSLQNWYHDVFEILNYSLRFHFKLSLFNY